MVRLTDRPDMTLDVYRGYKTTMQQQPGLQIAEVKVRCRSYFPDVSGRGCGKLCVKFLVKLSFVHTGETLHSAEFLLMKKENTVELQWLEHLWDHEN